MKKILHIEDEVDQVTLVRALLERRGYEVLSAKNAQEGLEKATKEKPSLILLDVFLPKSSGFELCKQLRESFETKNIPIIMVTGSGDKHIEEQCKNAGANGCLVKPFVPEDLISKIEGAIQ